MMTSPLRPLGVGPRHEQLRGGRAFFLGADPCTDGLGETVARDDDGFILTGAAAGSPSLLETNVPGLYAAGDVRAGSFKRCATAIGEGAGVDQFVHRRLAGVTA